MSVSVETYIVISLMFAVFAAVAAVGTSVVLGAGFERIRAGLDQVRRQSGFFADAIYKLDQRTQKLDEEHMKLKSGMNSLGERMERTEKTHTFLADAITSVEQRILTGSPTQPVNSDMRPKVRMNTVHTVSQRRIEQPQPKVQMSAGWISKPAREQISMPVQASFDERPPMENLVSGLFRDYPEEAPVSSDIQDMANDGLTDPQDNNSGGITTLLSRYFMGESSGGSKGVVYH